ncbi:SDR family NAD(P)-dependent oxidoreductase [Taklimakanibacter deserti]|uniref:SDR family NAD(P)-dependent oxidoreductase n=1 Tax=Taklimakanibacter deserti TaxID=2267839 RepID=UPI000E657D47
MAAAQRLKDRVALVTGGAQGIGAAIARRLAEEGARVVIGDVDDAKAKTTAREIGGETLRVDIADDTTVTALAQAIDKAHGRLDILVNNAAILDATPFDELTMTRFAKVLDINLKGALAVTLATAPLLRKATKGGRVLNIASIMGVRGSVASLAYSTAKGGLVNMTRCLACDLAPDRITANALCPGFINTRMALLPDGSGHEHETDWFKDIYLKYGRIPVGRAGLPEDIAGPAYFLVSDDAAYVTGQVLLVDGGVSATF